MCWAGNLLVCRDIDKAKSRLMAFAIRRGIALRFATCAAASLLDFIRAVETELFFGKYSDDQTCHMHVVVRVHGSGLWCLATCVKYITRCGSIKGTPVQCESFRMFVLVVWQPGKPMFFSSVSFLPLTSFDQLDFQKQMELLNCIVCLILSTMG